MTAYYYVNHGLAGGDNSGGDGTYNSDYWTTKAWRDVDNINWTTLNTAAATQPVYLYFKKGVTVTNDSFTITAGGSSETNRIILTIDPTDTGTTPTFNGTGMGAGTNFVAASDGANYITIQNFKFTTSPANSGIFSKYATSGSHSNNYWTWEDCTFEDVGTSGFYCGNSPFAALDYWVFRRCLFDNVGFTEGTPYRHVTYIENSDNWTVEYCKFLDTPTNGLMWRDGSDNWIVRYNYFQNIGSSTDVAQARAAINPNNENFASTGAEIYGNVMNGCRKGIYVYNGNTVNKIYHNTVYSSTTQGLTSSGVPAFGDMRNNIFWIATTNVIYASAAGNWTTENYNTIGPEGTNFIYCGGNYSTMAAWKTPSGPGGANDNATTPSFNNAAGGDFSLTSSFPGDNTLGSPYNLGLPSSWQWNVGSEGGKVSPTLVARTNFDRGAYEYQTTNYSIPNMPIHKAKTALFSTRKVHPKY